MTKFYYGLCLILAAMLAGYIGGLLSHFTPISGGTLKVDRVEIEDKQHRTRLVLGLSEKDQQPGLITYYPDGKYQITLCSIEGNPSLRFYDKANVVRMQCMIGQTDEEFTAWDTRGNKRVGFKTGDEESAFAIWNRDGKQQAVIGDSGHGPVFGLLDEKGNNRLILSASEGDGGNVSILDSKMKTLWHTP